MGLSLIVLRFLDEPPLTSLTPCGRYSTFFHLFLIYVCSLMLIHTYTVIYQMTIYPKFRTFPLM